MFYISHVLFSMRDPRAPRSRGAQRPSASREVVFPRLEPYKYGKDIEVLIVVDFARAFSMGTNFRQTYSFAGLSRQTVPPEAIARVEILNGFVIWSFSEMMNEMNDQLSQLQAQARAAAAARSADREVVQNAPAIKEVVPSVFANKVLSDAIESIDQELSRETEWGDKYSDVKKEKENLVAYSNQLKRKLMAFTAFRAKTIEEQKAEEQIAGPKKEAEVPLPIIGARELLKKPHYPRPTMTPWKQLRILPQAERPMLEGCSQFLQMTWWTQQAERPSKTRPPKMINFWMSLMSGSAA